MAMKKIQQVSFAALGLGDAGARGQLESAEAESAVAAQRSISYGVALGQANDRLAELQSEKAAILHQIDVDNHEAAKSRALLTANALSESALALKAHMKVFRSDVKELIDSARKTGINDPQYSRIQGLMCEWLHSQLIAPVRVPAYLDKPLSKLVSDFLAHWGGENDDDDIGSVYLFRIAIRRRLPRS